jgi:hypothetical protein
MARMYCTKCDTGRGGVFCPECGTKLTDGTRTCPCGYDNIWPHENFCSKCGLPAPSLLELRLRDRVDAGVAAATTAVDRALAKGESDAGQEGK